LRILVTVLGKCLLFKLEYGTGTTFLFSDMEGVDKEKSDSHAVEVNIPRTLPNCLENLIKTGQNSDVELVVGEEGATEHYHAHKLILAARSDVFQAMFYGPIKETTDRICIPDCDPEAFKLVINFIYTDVIANIPASLVVPLLYIGRKYMIQHLQDPVFILDLALTNKSVCSTLRSGLESEENEVVNICLSYFCLNASAIIKQEEFVTDPSKDVIDLIVKKRNLDIEKEVDLFQAVYNWAKHQCATDNLAVTSKNLRLYLGNALNMIGFTTMSASDIANIVQPTKLVPVTPRGQFEYKTTFKYRFMKSPGMLFIKLRFSGYVRLSSLEFPCVSESTYNIYNLRETVLVNTVTLTGKVVVLIEEPTQRVVNMTASSSGVSSSGCKVSIENSPTLRPNITYVLCPFTGFTPHNTTNVLQVWKVSGAKRVIGMVDVYMPLGQTGLPDQSGCLGYYIG